MTQAPGSETSVIVSWDRSTSSAVTGYTVYYSRVSGRKRQANEMSVTVPSTESSVRIDGLVSGAVYQFQVTVTIMFLGETIEGERTDQSDMCRVMLELLTIPSPVTTATTATCEPEGGGKLFFAWLNLGVSFTMSVIDADVKVAISVVVTFLLTAILNTSLLLLGYCILKARRANSSKEKYVQYIHISKDLSR